VAEIVLVTAGVLSGVAVAAGGVVETAVVAKVAVALGFGVLVGLGVAVDFGVGVGAGVGDSLESLPEDEAPEPLAPDSSEPLAPDSSEPLAPDSSEPLAPDSSEPVGPDSPEPEFLLLLFWVRRLMRRGSSPSRIAPIPCVRKEPSIPRLGCCPALGAVLGDRVTASNPSTDLPVLLEAVEASADASGFGELKSLRSGDGLAAAIRTHTASEVEIERATNTTSVRVSRKREPR